MIDLTGQRFGLWTVVGKDGNSERGAALWRTVCDCGNVGSPSGTDLRKGKSTSCGCASDLRTAERLRTHGGAGTRLYRIWKNMRARCNRVSHPQYAEYGGAGIKICAQWEDFAAFREWALENGYAADLSIDRKENELGYDPGNCRWATDLTQSENRRFVHRAPDGRPWSAIAREHGIPVTVMHNRIFTGWPIESAATLPKGSRLR